MTDDILVSGSDGRDCGEHERVDSSAKFAPEKRNDDANNIESKMLENTFFIGTFQSQNLL
jgi:hypothetical protein